MNNGVKICFFSRILSFNHSTLELYSSKKNRSIRLKKTRFFDFVFLWSPLCKVNMFSCLYFFPYTVIYAYNFSVVNHLLLAEVKVLFYVKSSAFVGYISSTFVSRTRVFSSFLYRLFNNRACSTLIIRVLFFILPHFGTVLLHFGTVLLHFGTLIFYFTTLWYRFYHTLALEIGSPIFYVFKQFGTFFTFDLKVLKRRCNFI